MRLETRVRPSDPEFRANAEHMARLVAELRAARQVAAQGGSDEARARHTARGKLLVRERVERLLDPGTPFLELSPLAAHGCYDDDAPGRRHGDRHRHDRGPAGDGRRQRRDGEGRHLLPAHGEEASPRPGDRAREPAALRLPGRLRRRVPAAAGRGVPRPRSLRAHLLQPGAHVGCRHPAGRGRARLVHRGRRLRARDVRRGRDRRQPGDDLPRRAAAGEGRDRRGGHRRGARRRRRPHPPLRRRRPPGAGRRRRAPHRARDLGRRARSAAAGAGARDVGAAGVRPRGASRHRRARSPTHDGRPRGHRAAGRRQPLPRVQAALRPDARDRLRAPARLPGRHPRQPGRAVLGVGAQGDALHRAGLRPRRPAALPAEHHRLHRRQALRARRHREGRREDGARGRERRGAEADRAHRRVARRRQLRHVRARLLAALPLLVAEQPHLRDGRRAGGPDAAHRQAPAARGAGRDAGGRGGGGAGGADPRQVRDRGQSLLRDRTAVGRRHPRSARRPAMRSGSRSRPRCTRPCPGPRGASSACEPCGAC